jgi:hypothetical protein
MSGLNKIGRGELTPLKQEHFSIFFRQYVAISEQILKKHRWADCRLCVFDITAGSGINPETGQSGSPLIITETLKERGLDFRAYFIEQEPDNCADLRRELRFAVERTCNSEINVICGDHVVELPLILSDLRSVFYGLLYYDFTTQNFHRSLAFLADLYTCRAHRKRLKLTDCMLYLAGTAIKRVRGAYPERPSLLSYLRRIPKDYWLIREKAGANQYTFLVGTNWYDMPACESIGLYPLNSKRGRDIFLEINYTEPELRKMQEGEELFYQGKKPYQNYSEYLQQPEFQAIRKEVLARANFLCERCGWAEATEVHHIIYPPWGTWDTADNLRALCHACHSRLEGKRMNGKAI